MNTFQPDDPKSQSAKNQFDGHIRATTFHEKAIIHHKQAAFLYTRGDFGQADMHSNMACKYALSAIEAARPYKTWSTI